MSCFARTLYFWKNRSNKKMENDVLIFTQWLEELKGDKETLKLMLYIGANADNKNYICRCTLKQFREWLGQKSKTSNKKNIARLEQLQKQQFISYTTTGNTYNIKVNADNKDIIPGIKKQWLEQIRGANRDKDYKKIDQDISTDWLQAFFLFVNIHTGTIRGLTTQTAIANILKISKPTVNGALKLLNLCNFDNLKCGSRTEKEFVKYRYETLNQDNEKIFIEYQQTRNIGTNIDYLENAF